jgi:hypothetical protein
VIIGLIQVFALWPKTDKGIFVNMEEASIVTILVVAVVTGDTSLYAGAVKLFAAHPSRKNPIVVAVVGSATGTTGCSPPGGGGGGDGVVSFLHDPNNTADTVKAEMNFNI